MRIDLTNRIVIVTGAGTGLGRAHAIGLAARGARVVVNDIGQGPSSEAHSVVAEITAAGGEAVADDTDVSDAKQTEAMTARTLSRWGRIDGLVNNAGVLRDKTLAKMDMADFRKVVDVHLYGAVNCT